MARPRPFHRLALVLLAAALLLGGVLTQAPNTRAAGTMQAEACFAETGRCIRGRFLDYWLINGGLARNGYPLSEEFRETLEDGREYTVQYFERVRLELHPENQPPYDVLLGHFGRRVLSAAYAGIRDYRLYQRDTAPVEPKPGHTYFPETGHNLGGRFLDYWLANGGLAQFGYPLTDERWDRLEDGKGYVTQYFERARFEYHPEYAGTPYEVLLGQFGREILRQNTLLTGSIARLYLGNSYVRERLGAPLTAAEQAPGATLAFERGRMFWRGDRRWIYVLIDTNRGNSLLLDGYPWRPYFIDTWDEGQAVGGGPAPAPGLYYPARGFGKLWREEELQPLLGYARTPNETGYTITVQEFGGGFLLSSDTAEGRFLYAVYLQRTSHAGAPITVYERYAEPAR